MYNIFRLLIGVPDYSSSESYGEKQKLILVGFIVISRKIEKGSERRLYKYINHQAVDVQNEREENTIQTYRDNKSKY